MHAVGKSSILPQINSRNFQPRWRERVTQKIPPLMQEIGVLETNVVERPVRDLHHHLRDLGGEFLSMKNLRDLNRTYLRLRCISLTEIAFWINLEHRYDRWKKRHVDG